MAHEGKQVTQATGWKSKTQSDSVDLELPSGNVCRVRRIAPEAFLEGGMIPDPIMPMIQKAIKSKKGLPPAEVEKLQEDPKKIISAVQMFDRVLVYAVVEPKVELPPVCSVCSKRETDVAHLSTDEDGFHRYNESEERDEDVLYADVVDLEDKMFIFQWCLGGAADVGRFRDEFATDVESSPAG